MPRPPAWGHKLYSLQVPRLPEDLSLPPLPPITDKKLEQVATTHTSVYQVSKDTFDLDVDNYSEILDYEKLEFIGDKIISLCADLAVQEIHPNMRQGMASRVHDCLVSNQTLAQLAERYKIINMLKTSVAAGYQTRMQVKTKGSVFESYVAGVFYSFMSAGATTSSEGTDREDQDKPSAPLAIGFGGDDAPLPISSPEAVRGTGDHAPKSKYIRRTKVVHFEDPRSESSIQDQGDDIDTQSSDSEDSDSESTDDGDDAVSECGSNMLKILYAEPNHCKDEVEQPEPNAQVNTKEQSMSVTPTDRQRDLSDDAPSPGGGRKTEGQAFDHVNAWLKPLFTSMAHFFIQDMQQEAERIKNDEVASLEQALEKKLMDEQAGGATAALNTYCENYFGRQPEYEITRSRPGIWKATCTITGFDGEEYSGVGEKATKRMAKLVASYQVAVQLKLWK